MHLKQAEEVNFMFTRKYLVTHQEIPFNLLSVLCQQNKLKHAESQIQNGDLLILPRISCLNKVNDLLKKELLSKIYFFYKECCKKKILQRLTTVFAKENQKAFYENQFLLLRTTIHINHQYHFFMKSYFQHGQLQLRTVHWWTC